MKIYFRILNNFLAGKTYPLLFSFLYASFIGMLFYPGLLYTDSVVRWNTAISIANGGLTALVGASDHHPILPILLMAKFYQLTGEIGFFAITQIFFFSYLFFLFVRRFSPNIMGNTFSSLALLLPINQVYSVFISYDSLFSIFFILLYLVFLTPSNIRIIAIPIVVAMLIGTRINSITILPFVILILFTQRISFSKLWHWQLTSMLTIALSVTVLFTPSLLKMEKSNGWLIGVAWEYANLATKTNDTRDIDFLNSFGVKPSDFSNDICYRGIWCGKEKEVFIDKIPNNRSVEVMEHYMLIARDHPNLFLTEKMKYIKSLMGVSNMPLANAEIGRWRNEPWTDYMQQLGFKTSEKKENYINRFFDFSTGIGKVFFRPWIIFIVLGFLTIKLINHEKIIGILTILPFFYYGSFFITSQNHELRYFFPVIYIFMAYLAVVFSLYTKKLSEIINRKIST